MQLDGGIPLTVVNKEPAENSDNADKAVKECVSRLREGLGNNLPELALILGSGFQKMFDESEVLKAIEFHELPGFPALRVKGHPGRLLLVKISEIPVLVFSGRAHYYEGHTIETVTFPIRVMAGAGVKQIVLTNAAGGINRDFRPGDFMLLADHINFTGINPLRGFSVEDGRCFVDLSETYSKRLRRELFVAAKRIGLGVREGVYLGVSGPTYETPAEIRAFRKLGADAVGMSTISEVIMARYSGIEVAAISCITNFAAGMQGRNRLSHEEVLKQGWESAAAAGAWLREFAANRGHA